MSIRRQLRLVFRLERFSVLSKRMTRFHRLELFYRGDCGGAYGRTDHLCPPGYHFSSPRRKNLRGNGLGWAGKSFRRKMWFSENDNIFQDIRKVDGTRNQLAGYFWRPADLDI